MHELSLAFELVDQALGVAMRENAKKVLSLKVKIGTESGVDAESFKFAFPEVAKDTLLASSRLIIENSMGRDFQFLSMEIEDV